MGLALGCRMGALGTARGIFASRPFKPLGCRWQIFWSDVVEVGCRVWFGVLRF